MKILTITLLMSFLVTPGLAAAQSGDIIRQGVRNVWEEMRQCPEGWECVSLERFERESNEKDLRRYDVAGITAEKGFDRLVVLQEMRGRYGVIVNTVRVGRPGRRERYTHGARLPAGRTEMDVSVPAGTAEILMSFDHGRGARIEVVLERRLGPGR